MMIDFVIAGFQKCGTSTIAEKLAEHPEINFSKNKEPHFFSKNAMSKEVYQKLFDQASHGIKGEGSTSYGFTSEYGDVVKNLHDNNPNLKIIFIAREPVERIRSHFGHRIVRKRLTSTDYLSELQNKSEYIDRTMYYATVMNYLEKFNESQILLLTLERIKSETGTELDRITEFLGIKPFDVKSIAHANKSYDTKTTVDSWQSMKKLTPVAYFPGNLRNRIRDLFFTNSLQQITLDNESISYINEKTSTDFSNYLKMMEAQVV